MQWNRQIECFLLVFRVKLIQSLSVSSIVWTHLSEVRIDEYPWGLICVHPWPPQFLGKQFLGNTFVSHVHASLDASSLEMKPQMKFSSRMGGRWGGRAVSILGTTKTTAFSANAQSRFVSIVLDDFLGPPISWGVDFGRQSKSQSGTRFLLNFC